MVEAVAVAGVARLARKARPAQPAIRAILVRKGRKGRKGRKAILVRKDRKATQGRKGHPVQTVQTVQTVKVSLGLVPGVELRPTCLMMSWNATAPPTFAFLDTQIRNLQMSRIGVWLRLRATLEQLALMALTVPMEQMVLMVVWAESCTPLILTPLLLILGQVFSG